MTQQSKQCAHSRVLHWLLIAFVLASCVRVWLGPANVVPSAQAQIPDSGLQRQKQLDAINQTNSLLQQIQATLEHGTLNVRVAGTDKKGGKTVVPPGQPQR